jgi:hypothetical protein
MMFPNIKQKKKGKGRGRRLRYRSNASKNFDFKLYRWRGMIEAIFGAEESKDQRLHTRFRKDEKTEVGDDHSYWLGPEGSEQAKVYKGAGNGGEIDHKKLGDNLALLFWYDAQGGCNKSSTILQEELQDVPGRSSACLSGRHTKRLFHHIRRR